MSPECQVLQQENMTLMVDERMHGVPKALAATADQLGLELVVSDNSDEFAEAQDGQRLLAATAALCGVARHAAADAEDCLAGIDPELPGLLSTSEL
jgi:hypothetical protein